MKRNIAKILSLALIFSIGVSFVGCKENLTERQETRAIKSVITHVNKNVSNSKIVNTAMNFSDVSDAEKQEYIEESYSEQENALFYCKMAVYIYESNSNLKNNVFYHAAGLGDEDGALTLLLNKAENVISMQALYAIESEYSYVDLTVDYDEHNRLLNEYILKEINVLQEGINYFENSYVARSETQAEIGCLYSARYESDTEEYYIFQNDRSGAKLALGESALEEVITTVHGEKTVTQHLADLRSGLQSNVKLMQDCASESFAFSYKKALKYIDDDSSFGHKANKSSKEEGIAVPVVFHESLGMGELQVTWAALDGMYFRPHFPLPVGGTTHIDEEGAEWIFEGYYYDPECTMPVSLENIPYNNETKVHIYLNWEKLPDS